MNLTLDKSLAASYTSNSQIARVVTEKWMAKNMFCPRCGNDVIIAAKNNQPASDFSCPLCRNTYELKSANGKIPNKITAGAYSAMMARIQSNTGPDFFFMSYDLEAGMVNDLMFVPKHFFTSKTIEKRKPLAASARRAGWTGCNILLHQISQEARIYIVKQGTIYSKPTILDYLNKTSFLESETLTSRGWLLDIMHCINRLGLERFSLGDIYTFEFQLAKLHPENKHIRPKVRQQLQILRDKGYLEFSGMGYYKIL